MRRLIVIIFVLFSGLGLLADNISSRQGVLDARSFDFNHKALKLKGFWEFYPGQMLKPENFHGVDPLPGVEYIWQPSLGIYSIRHLKKIHCGTLRLIILTGDNFPDSIFYQTGTIHSSASVFLNNEKIIDIGHPACNKTSIEIIEDKKLIIRNLTPLRDKVNNLSYIQVIIQVSSYTHGLGTGIKYPPRIGREKDIEKRNLVLVFFQLGLIFFVISLAIIFLSFLVIKKHYKDRQKYFFLAVLAIAAAIKIFLGNKIFLPPIPAEAYIDIQYLCIIFAMYALIHFLYYYKKGLITNKCLTSWSLVISLSLLTYILGLALHSGIIFKVSHGLTILTAIFLLTNAFCLSVKNKSAFFSLAFFFSITAAAVNFLSLIGVITGFIPEGLAYFVFLLFVTIDEAIQSEKIMIQNKRLAYRLIQINKYLNKILAQRTKKIIIQSKKLEKINQELKRQNDQLLKAQSELTQKSIIIENQSTEIQKSIEYAQNFQNGILPTEQEIQQYLDAFVIYLPKYIVSGDFYLFKHADTAEYIGVFDCTGHGVPGAFLSILSYKVIEQAVIYMGMDDITEILNFANKELGRLMSGRENYGDGFEFGIIRIDKTDTQQRHITFWGSKKIPLFYYHQEFNQITRHRLKNPMIGTIQGTIDSLEKIEITAQKGDMIWLATDGFVDQTNHERRRFGTNRMIKLLNRIARLSTEEQKHILLQTFEQWRDGETQIDDVTLIGIRL